MISLFDFSRVGATVSYYRVTPTEPSVIERAVRRRHSGISLLWILATGPIANIYNIDTLRLASVRPTGLVPAWRAIDRYKLRKAVDPQHGMLHVLNTPTKGHRLMFLCVPMDRA